MLYLAQTGRDTRWYHEMGGRRKLIPSLSLLLGLGATLVKWQLCSPTLGLRVRMAGQFPVNECLGQANARTRAAFDSEATSKVLRSISLSYEL